MSSISNLVEDFIAGWTGGVCGLIVGHPLDTVKVRQQAYGTKLWPAIRMTYQHEGARGFYKGMFFPMLTVGASNAIFFGIYGHLMKTFRSSDKLYHVASIDDYEAIQQVYIAGSIAGIFQAFFTCPFELIKTVQQANTEGKGKWEKKKGQQRYNSSLDAIRKIVEKRGIRGLFRGITPMLLRDVPTSGLYTLTYDLVVYTYLVPFDLPLVVKQFLGGGSAGIMSWVTVVPMDVIKSQMQADDPDHANNRSTRQYISENFRKGGVRIFFRGLPAICLRTFPSNAALFIGYETALELFQEIDPH